MARTKSTVGKSGKGLKSAKGIKQPRPSKTLQSKEKGKQSMPSSGGVRRPHRYRPGTVALREIRKYQKSTELLTRRLPFQRMVKRLLTDINKDDSDLKVLEKRFQAVSIDILREAAEMNAIQTLEKSNLAAFHAKRITLMGKDLDFIERIERMSA